MGNVTGHDKWKRVSKALGQCADDLRCLDTDDQKSSVTFEATFNNLDTVIAEAFEEAGPSTVYTVVLPENDELGYLYVDGDSVPAEQPGDWTITGSNPDEIVAAIKLLIV